jgi:hypothetical protein
VITGPEYIQELVSEERRKKALNIVEWTGHEDEKVTEH